MLHELEVGGTVDIDNKNNISSRISDWIATEKLLTLRKVTLKSDSLPRHSRLLHKVEIGGAVEGDVIPPSVGVGVARAIAVEKGGVGEAVHVTGGGVEAWGGSRERGIEEGGVGEAVHVTGGGV